MNSLKSSKCLILAFMMALFALTFTEKAGAQAGETPRFVLGIHADLVSWFGSDNSGISNKGARPGFNFGLSVYRYFGPNYAFSTGISIISSGGRLVSSDTTVFYSSDAGKVLKMTKVNPGQSIVYKIQYVSIPIGLKLQTNQIGYLTFFTDLGLDPKVVIGGKADIPSKSIDNESAMEELRVFNMSYHFTAGAEYGLGGNTALVLGLRFDNNFLDITREKGEQPVDKITHKMISFMLGVNF